MAADSSPGGRPDDSRAWPVATCPCSTTGKEHPADDLAERYVRGQASSKNLGEDVEDGESGSDLSPTPRTAGAAKRRKPA
ncbi:hypothetical protein GCM10022255_113840 [Dactylosporangium darangshiense]|uniref:Transposase n=1 Tax=Dactylosporangium darangshiense TaxID=579108 RepID=A0ABP8DVN8_9ACTN